MIEDFKVKSATLAEVRLLTCFPSRPSLNTVVQVDVVLIPYEIFLRPPGQLTQRYSIKVYDEPNVASMVGATSCLLEWRSI